MKYLNRLLTALQNIRQTHGTLASSALIVLILFALVIALVAVLALLGMLLWVSPYLGAGFVVLLLIVLSV